MAANHSSHAQSIAAFRRYFTALDNLDAHTDVICLHNDKDAPPERWSIHDVQAFFEDTLLNHRGRSIVCPRLPSDGLPRNAVAFNLARKNNSELMRLMEADPHFLCHVILATKTASHAMGRLAFDTWVCVREGQALALNHEQPCTSGHPGRMPLPKGCMAVFQKDMQLELYFEETSLVEIGCIVPAGPSS